MKKRLLSLFCALSLLLTLLPTGVFAVEAGNEEAIAQAGDTGAVKVAAGAEWEGLTLTPITASPDDGDLPVLFAAENGAEAPAAWSKAFFGDQLTKLLPDACYTGATKTQGTVARELYDALCAADSATLQKGGPISITLEKTDPRPASDTSEWTKKYQTMAGHLTDYQKVCNSIAASAIAAFDRDRSDIFWLGNSSVTLSQQINGKPVTPGQNSINAKDVYSIQLQVTFDISNSWKATSENGKGRDIAADTNTVTTAVAAIKAEAENQTSRRDRLKAVHDWLTKNNAYNEDALKPDNKNSDGYLDTTPWEAISALTNEGNLNPVCEGYARAFKLICDALDIPCVLVSGRAGVTESNREPHMWNYVQMEDNKWYAVDVTWDDPVLQDGSSGDGKDTYFLVGADTKVVDETTFSGNHNKSSNDFLTVGHAAFTYPALSLTKCDSTAAAKKSIATAVIHLDPNQSIYAGEVRTVKTTGGKDWVTLDGNALKSGVDYSIAGGYATDVGNNTLTITGKGDYTGIATATWSLQKATPKADDFDIPTLNAGGYNYTGKPCVVPTPTLKAPKTGAGTVTVYYESADKTAYPKSTKAPTDAGVYTVTFDVADDGKNYTSATDLEIGKLLINQVAYSADLLVNSAAKIGENGQVDLSGLIAPGGTAAIVDKTDTNTILNGDPSIAENKTLNFNIKSDAQAGQTATVKVRVTAKNYKEYTITVTLTATTKTPQKPLKFTNKNNATVTYGQTLQLELEGGTGDGTVSYKTTDNGGTVTVDEKGLLTATRTGVVRIVATKAGDDTHEAATAILDITVTPAPLTIQVLDQKIYVGDALPGAPKENTHYTVKGLVNGDTVKDTVKGTAKLVYQKNDTAVTPVTTTPGEYKITLTGLTTEQKYGHNNYALETRPGKLTISARPGGGSSGSGSSSSSSGSNPTIKTETKTNPDGSTTKTETRKDGSVTQTTTGKDGSVSKTETKKDGSSVTENKAANGSTGTVKTDKNGQTTAETTLSSKAIEDAKKSGEPVKAPVQVKAARNSGAAPTVKVELPQNAGKTEVEIPVTNVKPGTVAVLVRPDGTEEIVKNSIPTEDGIQLTVSGGATVKIMDNSKDFGDIQSHWAKDAIDFVSARELVNGISATRYAPDATATRAQLWTILARQNDTDLSGGANWYEKAQLWSKDKGISDGTNPGATITRAQMVTMLWRTMGQPAAGGSASFADVPAGSYYEQAVAWAVESGITQGVGGGRFDPNATCTRAQIAAFLARSMK